MPTITHNNQQIEAVQWTGNNIEEVEAFTGKDLFFTEFNELIEGIEAGDYVVKLSYGFKVIKEKDINNT